MSCAHPNGNEDDSICIETKAQGEDEQLSISLGLSGRATVVICFVTDEKRKIYYYSFQSSSHAGHESGQTMLCQFRVATLDVKDCECITYKRTTQHVA